MRRIDSFRPSSSSIFRCFSWFEQRLASHVREIVCLSPPGCQATLFYGHRIVPKAVEKGSCALDGNDDSGKKLSSPPSLAFLNPIQSRAKQKKRTNDKMKIIALKTCSEFVTNFTWIPLPSSPNPSRSARSTFMDVSPNWYSYPPEHSQSVSDGLSGWKKCVCLSGNWL